MDIISNSEHIVNPMNPVYPWMTGLLSVLLLAAVGWLWRVHTQNKQLNAELKRLIDRNFLYRAIIENQTDLLCRFRPDWKLSFVNEAFCRHFQKQSDQLIGTNLLDLFSDEDQQSFDEYVQSISHESPTRFLEMVFQTEDESPQWYWWTTQGFFDKNGAILEYQAVAKDITVIKNSEEALRQMKEEAESANRSKSEFLANMSHELRTPLNSVIGFASILVKNKNNRLSEKEITYIQRILENGKHLLNLINQILDLSKIEAGRLDLQISTFRLDELIRTIFNQLESQVRGKKISLKADIPRQMHPIQSDEFKLRQILINLLGNAIKFTEHGSVTVKVECDMRTRLPSRIDVIDTGIGIPNDRLDAIFAPFQQADSSTSRKYGGTGLGLAISKSLCHLLGYRIEISSVVGEGSTFSVILQHPESTHAEREPRPGLAETYREQIDFVGKTILVIDDEADSRLLLKDYLEDLGCRVILADSGSTGLEIANREKLDVIMLDLIMPEMNGWEVIIELKSNPSLRNVPIIVVSIVAREIRGVNLGLIDLLDKPINRDELLEVLRRNLKPKSERILIIEDQNAKNGRLVHTLNLEHASVLSMHHQAASLDPVDSFQPDLIVVDVTHCGTEGIALVKQIKDCQKYKSLPVIAITPSKPGDIELEQLQQLSSAIVHEDENFDLNFKIAVNQGFAKKAALN